jgi:hypothetical protein
MDAIGANRRIFDVADRAYLWKIHFDKPENESPFAEAFLCHGRIAGSLVTSTQKNEYN